VNSCAANECTSNPSLGKSKIASVRCKLFLRGRGCRTEPPLYATANRPHRFRNFLVAPSDRFKSFSGPVASGGALRGSCRRLIGPHPENALCRLVLSHHHGFHVAVAQRTAGCSVPASSAVCNALTPALPHLIKSEGERAPCPRSVAGLTGLFGHWRLLSWMRFKPLNLRAGCRLGGAGSCSNDGAPLD
jgi:hypothetical protein